MTKNENAPHATRYTTQVWQIALAGMFLGIIALSAFLSSSTVMPRIPLLNGRIDFWYAVFFIALIIVRDWKLRCLIIVATPLLLIPLEISSYLGWADYAVELITPVLCTLPLAPVLPGRLAPALQVGGTIILFTAMRLGSATLAGHFFYRVPWLASLTYNAPNIGVDAALCFIAVPLTLVKLRRVAAIK